MSARNVQPAPLLQRAGAMLAHVLRLDWREAVPALFGLAATLVLAMAWLLGSSPSLGAYLGDTDDALRLVTVRELLAGAPWFDTTLPRVGAPDVLVSHWSRLIDLPLAVLVTAFTPLVGAARAEIVVRAIWPLLLFLLLAVLIVHEARRRAESTDRTADGLWAAGAATVLMLMSVTALGQFAPGRIDHHNAQILCAVGGLLLLVRSWHEPRLGWWSGVLLGLGLAIGYEAIALTAAALGLAGVAAVAWPDRGEGVLRAATGASAVLLIAFLATVSPAYWLDVRCDALSLNLPTLALCCTAGLAIALRQLGGLVLRLAIAGAGAAIGGLAYATLEPACLAGPFG